MAWGAPRPRAARASRGRASCGRWGAAAPRRGGARRGLGRTCARAPGATWAACAVGCGAPSVRLPLQGAGRRPVDSCERRPGRREDASQTWKARDLCAHAWRGAPCRSMRRVLARWGLTWALAWRIVGRRIRRTSAASNRRLRWHGRSVAMQGGMITDKLLPTHLQHAIGPIHTLAARARPAPPSRPPPHLCGTVRLGTL